MAGRCVAGERCACAAWAWARCEARGGVEHERAVAGLPAHDPRTDWLNYDPFTNEYIGPSVADYHTPGLGPYPIEPTFIPLPSIFEGNSVYAGDGRGSTDPPTAPRPLTMQTSPDARWAPATQPPTTITAPVTDDPRVTAPPTAPVADLGSALVGYSGGYGATSNSDVSDAGGGNPFAGAPATTPARSMGEPHLRPVLPARCSGATRPGGN